MKRLAVQGAAWGAAVTIVALGWSWIISLLDAPVLGLPAVVVLAPGDAVARFFVSNAHGSVLFSFWIGTNLIAGGVIGGIIALLRTGERTEEETEPRSPAYRR